MASSSRPRRSQGRVTRRVKKAPPKKRGAAAAAAKPRKSAMEKAVAKKASAKKVAARTSRKEAAPGIVETALATFAHEVRTPLTGILAISDLLATSELDERERRWVDTIKAGAEHLASLATLFVDAAKSQASPAALREDLFDLRALARNAGDSLAGRAAGRGRQADIDISARLPALVVGDPIRLRAALENLIDNAVKFTDSGGVALVAVPERGSKGGKV